MNNCTLSLASTSVFQWTRVYFGRFRLEFRNYWFCIHLPTWLKESLRLSQYFLIATSRCLAMRILFALLAFATSMRVEVFNQTQLPKGGKGEKCSCNKDPVAKQDCCAAGLVCSKLRKCQPALGSPCEKSAFHKVFGGSECSSSSYQERHSKRKIICQPKPEGKSVCCVKKGSVSRAVSEVWAI